MSELLEDAEGNKCLCLTVGSLFSGIGGIELGLERTGGFKTIWQCENDEYASAVLHKHWPSVPNLGDITKVDWAGVEKPDLICGGFPCQDISVAGKGKGIREGERSGLWREFARAIREIRPRYALIENVSALATRGLDVVLADLAEAGYDAEWLDLRASDVGAPHRRERLFIVAYIDFQRLNGGNDNQEQIRDFYKERKSAEENKKRRWNDATNCNSETDASDTACARQLREKQQENNSKGNERRGTDDIHPLYERKQTTTTSDNRENRIQSRVQGQIHRFPEFSWCENVRRVEDLRGRTDIPEPLIRGTDDGIPDWMDRLKCLANAVVPQVAEVIGDVILEREKVRMHEKIGTEV